MSSRLVSNPCPPTFAALGVASPHDATEPKVSSSNQADENAHWSHEPSKRLLDNPSFVGYFSWTYDDGRGTSYGVTPVSLLIGICGGSGSGKTTLAALLADHFGHHESAAFAFDSYYRDQAHLTARARALVNFDHPDSLDHELFVEHLIALRASQEIAVPVYDFATHARTSDVHIIDPKPVVIVEGILLLAFPEIRKHLDLTVYRDCPESVRFERRLARDVAERGRTPESVEAQFATTVKPMHDRYVQPSIHVADVVTPFSEELPDANVRVLAEIAKLTVEVAAP